MVNTIKYVVTPGSGIQAVINGLPYSITEDNASFREVRDAIFDNEDPAIIADLFNRANAIKRYTKGNVTISEDGTLTYKGEVMHNVVVERIFAFMKEGYPVDPLIAFLERLLANPSKRAIEELYKFLEKEYLPITEDGCFLGYKAVTHDWLDKHTRKISNRIGEKPSMPRRDVDDDARMDCSNGLHVGSFDYASTFGSGDDRLLVVKVDPADVVSVPYSDANKLRACKYEVLCECTGPLDKQLAVTSQPYAEVQTIDGWRDSIGAVSRDGINAEPTYPQGLIESVGLICNL